MSFCFAGRVFKVQQKLTWGGGGGNSPPAGPPFGPGTAAQSLKSPTPAALVRTLTNPAGTPLPAGTHLQAPQSLRKKKKRTVYAARGHNGSPCTQRQPGGPQFLTYFVPKPAIRSRRIPALQLYEDLSV